MIPRSPVLDTSEPLHNRIPVAGQGIWLPLHGTLLPGTQGGLPTPTELGTPSGSKWGTSGVYSFPAVNADCALRYEDDDEDRFLGSQLSLYDAAVGSHIIVALDASYVAAPDGNSMLWCYGRNNSAASYIGLDVTSSEVPRFLARAKNSSAAAGPSMTAQSGTFAAFRNQGLFAVVLGIYLSAADKVQAELRMGNGTLSAYYTATDIDVLQTGTSGTALPGISGGITMADFGGLFLGGRGSNTLGAADNLWGRGTGNTGRIGNFQARKYAAYSATRVAEKLAKAIARPRDIVTED